MTSMARAGVPELTSPPRLITLVNISQAHRRYAGIIRADGAHRGGGGPRTLIGPPTCRRLRAEDGTAPAPRRKLLGSFSSIRRPAVGTSTPPQAQRASRALSTDMIDMQTARCLRRSSMKLHQRIQEDLSPHVDLCRARRGRKARLFQTHALTCKDTLRYGLLGPENSSTFATVHSD
uniref:Uncharacterized protein n=1 Tax=Branchiostoma floridae TaxID=7739 RepID=C3XY42_BRAFL|eukprot:XP_002611086.1 hypothetical protein BRAFLDRAFT_70435 [Branchiostoma floridae]